MMRWKNHSTLFIISKLGATDHLYHSCLNRRREILTLICNSIITMSRGITNLTSMRAHSFLHLARSPGSRFLVNPQVLGIFSRLQFNFRIIPKKSCRRPKSMATRPWPRRHLSLLSRKGSPSLVNYRLIHRKYSRTTLALRGCSSRMAL